MTKRKRLLAVGLVAALGFAAASCGDDDEDGAADTAGDTAATEDTSAATGGTVAGTTGTTTAGTGATATTTGDTGTTTGDTGTTTAGTGDTTGSTTGDTTDGTTGDTAGGEPAPAVENPSVGLLFDITGRGDRSFNDAAAAGLDQAESELGATGTESTPSAEGDRAERLATLQEQGNDLIIGVGFLWQPALTAAALEDTEQLFALIDAVAVDDQGTPDDFADDTPLPNVASLTFAEEQGSFLVGAAAALKTQTDTVGFLGGVEITLIKKFEAGFKAGVEAVNPDIEVLTSYITQPPDFNGFNDPARGKEIAASMYEDGADVIYAAAGGSGLGMFQAASEAGEPGEVWGIGVDSDAYNLVDPALQPYVLTSMLKKVEVAVFDAIERLTAGELTGGVTVYDLEADGVDYSPTGGFVDDIADQLDEFKQQIIDGEIEVPTEP